LQNKRFDEAELAAIPTLTGINTLVLEVTDEHRINFHGIRFKGRIFRDNAANNIHQHGYVTLLCVPNDQVALSGIFTVSDMIDWNAMIIAIMPWSTFSGDGDISNGGAGVFDFDITPKTSRTCAKGGKIVAQVTNAGLGFAIVNSLLTSFTTTV